MLREAGAEVEARDALGELRLAESRSRSVGDRRPSRRGGRHALTFVLTPISSTASGVYGSRTTVSWKGIRNRPKLAFFPRRTA